MQDVKLTFPTAFFNKLVPVVANHSYANENIKTFTQSEIAMFGLFHYLLEHEHEKAYETSAFFKISKCGEQVLVIKRTNCDCDDDIAKLTRKLGLRLSRFD